MGRHGRLLIGCCLTVLLGGGEDDPPPWRPACRGEAMHADLVRIAGLEFTDVSGTPTFDRHGLRIPDLTGRLYTGTVTAGLDHDADGNLRLDLEFEGLDLADFVRGFLRSDTDLAGTISGSTELTFTGNPNDPIHGSGEVHLVDGSLISIPFLAELLIGDPIARKGQDEIHLTFTIAKRRIFLGRIRAENPSVKLTGKGIIDFRGRMNAVFAPATKPAITKPIPVLDTVFRWLVQSVSTRIGRFQLLGYYRDPVVVLRPLEGVMTLNPSLLEEE